MEKFWRVGHEFQLNIRNLLERSVKWSPNQEIVYRDSFRYTYGECFSRVRRLANLYTDLGVKKGDVIAVMDWDSHRYLEHYFAVPMMGAILHTVNIRLSPEQMLYTINDAEDKVLVVHEDFFPILKAIEPKFETVEKIIVIKEKGEAEYASPRLVGEYEELIGQQSDDFQFDDALNEDTIATLFYTTGTTGNPKGVYFSHRQLVLHTLSLSLAAAAFHEPISFTCTDVYMPLTPMFHVHAWGVPYVATLLGVKQVYPGRYEPEMILKLLVNEKVTFSHCVPTILHMVVTHPATQNIDFSGWKVIIGGSALPRGLCEAAWKKGIRVISGYGLSETCPVLTLAQLKPEMFDWEHERKIEVYTKTGFPVPLVNLKIVDFEMNELPPGKENQGEIVVRTPWLTMGYYKSEENSKGLWRGGWLHTGDVAYVDDEGYVKITDRLKDVIKTGGEWVSSLELESLISRHEAVSEVAVVGVPDEKWGERPIAHVVLKPDFEGKVSEDDLKGFLNGFVENGTIEKWAVPDRFVFVDALPKTSVGKLDKKVIRKEYVN